MLSSCVTFSSQHIFEPFYNPIYEVYIESVPSGAIFYVKMGPKKTPFYFWIERDSGIRRLIGRFDNKTCIAEIDTDARQKATVAICN